jgi:sigma-E factor negative regulatory protein RseC
MTDSNNSGIINHKGIVQRREDNSVFVAISSLSACSGCHAEGSCGMTGKEEKIIEVRGKYNVNPGDQVTILMRQSMGYAALSLGYIIPAVVVIAVLLTLISFGVPELLSGLASIAILVPYYIVLYFFRKTINEKFTFTLKV